MKKNSIYINSLWEDWDDKELDSLSEMLIEKFSDIPGYDKKQDCDTSVPWCMPYLWDGTIPEDLIREKQIVKIAEITFDNSKDEIKTFIEEAESFRKDEKLF